MRVLALFVGLLAAGCTLGDQPIGTPTTSGSASGIAGIYEGIAWVAPSEIVLVTRGPLAPTVDRSLVAFDPGSRATSPIPVVKPVGCSEVSTVVPAVIDQELVFDLMCYPADYQELVSISASGGTPNALSPLSFFPAAYARLDGGRWAASYGPDLCAWVDLADKDLIGTAVPPPAWWPIEVTDDGPPFALNAGEGGTCDQLPLASQLVEAADGTFAFVASGTAARSAGGSDRLSVPYNLYLRHTDGSIVRIANGLERPVLTWRPDGTALAAVATIQGHSGAWLFDRAGRRTFLFEGRVSSVAWSPDGSSLAVLVETGASSDPDAFSTVVLLSVPAAVGT